MMSKKSDDSSLEVCQEYESSLQELKSNSKPHINMLTMLADENQAHASKIVHIIENHIQKVSASQKLPLLYLLDSIVKNCKKSKYPECVAKNLPATFAYVFRHVDEKGRSSMYKLRLLWKDVFPASKLCALDIKVNEIDPKWPIISKDKTKDDETPKRHETLRPSNVTKQNVVDPPLTSITSPVVAEKSAIEEMQQKELLLRLQQQKMELELRKAQELLKLQQTLEQQQIKKRPVTSPPPIVSSTSNVDDQQSNIGSWIPLKKPKLEEDVATFSQTVTPPVRMTPAPCATPSTSEKANLDKLPVNNRIFVDGRGYEVRFIEDAAIIERNNLPHRISFIGAAKDVVIDGIAHSLKFEETKEVLIDGQLHRIRFGAPSRELYLNDFPLRGSFGGPPIFATINGNRHKIQLCGPPPEVKISPEPSYELVRYLRSSHIAQGPVHDYGSSYQQRNVQVKTEPGYSRPLQTPTQMSAVAAAQPMAPPSINVAEILAKLMPIVAPQQQLPPPFNQHLAIPSISSTMRFQDDEVVVKGNHAPLNLKDFNPKLMKMRYSSVIESLYQKTIQCSTCGMRFVDGDTLKYSKHLDWHFKQNRKEKGIKSTARSWYFADEDWVHFEELGDDSTAFKPRSVVFETAQQTGRVAAAAAATTDCFIVANNEQQNFCSVCGDKFEQFWDGDDETWKLRNAVLVNSKAYHPLCHADVANGEFVPTCVVQETENGALWETINNPNETTSQSLTAQVKTEPVDETGNFSVDTVVKMEPADDYYGED